MITYLFQLLDQHYEGLSKTQRILCDYTREHYLDLSYLSIKELSERTGVSVGSITGFCKALGFNGFADFQRELQKMAQQELFSMREIKNSIAEPSPEEGVLKEIIDSNILNLQRTQTDLLDRAFQEAVNTLSSARRIYVIGLRSAYAVAHYFYFTLSDFKDNVTLLSVAEGDVYDHLMHIGPSDVLVSIGFKKYTRATCDVTRFFRERNCRIIALTDTLSSPIASLADTVLIAQNSSTTFSFVSAMTILNAIVVAMGRRDRKRAIRELDAKQAVLKEYNVHY
jgi:DNA-binding MurR/RpiR family transcriptional regulator